METPPAVVVCVREDDQPVELCFVDVGARVSGMHGARFGEVVARGRKLVVVPRAVDVGLGVEGARLSVVFVEGVGWLIMSVGMWLMVWGMMFAALLSAHEWAVDVLGWTWGGERVRAALWCVSCWAMFLVLQRHGSALGDAPRGGDDAVFDNARDPAPAAVVDEVMRAVYAALGACWFTGDDGADDAAHQAREAPLSVRVCLERDAVRVWVGEVARERVVVCLTRDDDDTGAWRDERGAAMASTEVARAVGVALRRRLLVEALGASAQPATLRVVAQALGASAPLQQDAEVRAPAVSAAPLEPARPSDDPDDATIAGALTAAAACAVCAVWHVVAWPYADARVGEVWRVVMVGAVVCVLAWVCARELVRRRRDRRAQRAEALMERSGDAGASTRALVSREGTLGWTDSAATIDLGRPFHVDLYRSGRAAVVEARQGDRCVRFGVWVDTDGSAWDTLPRLDADVELVDGACFEALWLQLVAHAQAQGVHIGWGFAWSNARERAGGDAEEARAAAVSAHQRA